MEHDAALLYIDIINLLEVNLSTSWKAVSCLPYYDDVETLSRKDMENST